MKKIVLLSIVIAALVLISPAATSATVVKRGVAVSRVTSQSSTSNSISLSSTGQSQQLFQAMTSSAGLTDTAAQIDGDEPASITSTGIGVGSATASGANTGMIGTLMLPEIKGTSISTQTAVSQSIASLK